MKNKQLRNSLLALFVVVFGASCTRDYVEPEVEKGKYENGFFVVNEGWFGRGTGEVSFFNYETGKLSDSTFKRENPTKDLNPTSSSLQYGTIYRDDLYLVSKAGGPMVVVDSKTLKEKGRIAAKGGNDWRAFVGIDENTGLLSSGSGVYVVNLKTFTANTKLVGVEGQVGDMIKGGNYIFMHSATDGLVIYNSSDLSLNKKIKGMSVGFAKTPNGKVWYTAGKYLYQTDPVSLAKDSVELNFTPFSAWGAWHAGSIAASTKENTVYVLKTGSFGGGNEVFRYTGTAPSVANVFITTPANQIFYGKGIGFDPVLNQVVITTVQSGWGANYAINNLYFYDPMSGALKTTLPYSGYHFPAMPVFHEK
ncbi:MAG: DUF5074 domain-containing protein [Pedobacter sp.]|nr:MAG: DUF5074 domain-containing protein [Pedobacter sp.]